MLIKDNNILLSFLIVLILLFRIISANNGINIRMNDSLTFKIKL